MIPELIPVKERHGYCEGPLCARPDQAHFTIRKKPMFTLGDQRVCKACCRKLQRMAAVDA